MSQAISVHDTHHTRSKSTSDPALLRAQGAVGSGLQAVGDNRYDVLPKDFDCASKKVVNNPEPLSTLFMF